ncbi:MAG: DUF4290 domain-containing protein [Alistipes sp.]|nr:DUF4290 domain-containing protein [Alistipes sp.]
MRKNYNFTRSKLYLPEYGRHIHQMVDSLLQIEDRQERTRQAKAVIAVMGNLNPMLRDTEEFKHKLWDHLFIMSDFKLDVDSPYMQPSRQDLAVRPEKLNYPQSRIMFKHYGKYAQKLLCHAVEQSSSCDVQDEVMNVARYLRAKSYEFNNEHPNNDSIARDIRLMTASDIDFDLSDVSAMRSEYRQHQPATRNSAKSKKPQHNQGRKPQKAAARHNQHK